MGKIQKIDPDKWYSLTDLAEMKAFPFLPNYKRYRTLIARDKVGKNHLKAMTMGDGRTKRYSFKGSNVIRFVELVNAGKVSI